MSESKLLSVVEHWLPRIEVAGIPSATAKEVITRAGDWAGWLPAWLEEADRNEAIAVDAEAKGWRVTAGEAYARAAACAHFGQFMAFEDLAAKAAAAERKCTIYRRAAPLLDPPAQPVGIPFEGAALTGYLRRPVGVDAAPLALIVPGSDSTKEEFPNFEKHFLARGIATFSLDGPGQGEGRLFGPLRPDITAAIAATLERLKGESGLSGKVALVGMAFGGNLVLRAASALPDLAAVVSINGFADLGAFAPALPQVYRDNLRFALGTEDVLGAAAGFTIANAPPIMVPALIIHGGRDKIFPVSEAEASARACSGRVDLHVLPEGNHVCNNIPWVYRPLVADWLGDRFADR
ncbi:alpha/beta hydrolase family protein [Devosia enhydra]|nr:alpha/beta hydrolase [Devosia enhydra]